MRRPVTLAMALAAASACLPDLDTSPLVTAASACGDGFIDLEAGESCDPGSVPVPGCSRGCVISCEKGFVDERTGHCYFADDPAQNAGDAFHGCLTVGAHVVTFTSDDEERFVDDRTTDSPSWVGLQLEPALRGAYAPVTPEEPGWAPRARCSGCYARVVAASGVFEAGEGGGTGCVMRTRGGASWRDSSCAVSQSASVLCEREPVGTYARRCELGVCASVLATRAVGKSYVYVATPTSAGEAERACASLGGRLVVFESREERDQVVRAFRPFSPSTTSWSFWMGLARAEGGSWTWADGSPLSTFRHPDPWGNEEPKATLDGARAYVVVADGAYDTQLAHADDGTEPHGYVCEKMR